MQYGVRQSIDGFTLFPKRVYGEEFSSEDHKLYWENIEKLYLTKSVCWEYEQEARLYTPAGSALSPIDRIFHYDSNQIAGVIYGMRMTEDNKKIIREILLRKSKERYIRSEGNRILFNIISFEAKFDDNQHSISITPSEIFDCGEAIKAISSEFTEKFTSWSNGEALYFQHTEKGTSCKKITLD